MGQTRICEGVGFNEWHLGKKKERMEDVPGKGVGSVKAWFVGRGRGRATWPALYSLQEVGCECVLLWSLTSALLRRCVRPILQKRLVRLRVGEPACETPQSVGSTAIVDWAASVTCVGSPPDEPSSP